MFKEIENKFDNCIYLYSKVNKNRCSPVNSGDWSLSNLMWVHASQPHEWFLLWLRQKELIRWLGYKCHICFREESFRRWRRKHGANRLTVRALRINHDTIIDIYFRAQELSNGFVGAAEASNLLPVATNFGFRIKCLCVLISLTFHSCLQLFVLLLGRNNLHRIRPSGLFMAGPPHSCLIEFIRCNYFLSLANLANANEDLKRNYLTCITYEADYDVPKTGKFSFTQVKTVMICKIVLW